MADHHAPGKAGAWLAMTYPLTSLSSPRPRISAEITTQSDATSSKDWDYIIASLPPPYVLMMHSPAACLEEFILWSSLEQSSFELTTPHLHGLLSSIMPQKRILTFLWNSPARDGLVFYVHPRASRHEEGASGHTTWALRRKIKKVKPSMPSIMEIRPPSMRVQIDGR